LGHTVYGLWLSISSNDVPLRVLLAMTMTGNSGAWPFDIVLLKSLQWNRKCPQQPFHGPNEYGNSFFISKPKQIACVSVSLYIVTVRISHSVTHSGVYL